MHVTNGIHLGSALPLTVTTVNYIQTLKVMSNMTHLLDPDSGRASTSAYPFFNDQDSSFLHQLDVPGYNYAGVGVYAKDHAKLPNRTMVGTESVAQDTMRVYEEVTQMPWVVGDFIWTAIDYLGDNYFPTTSGDVQGARSWTVVCIQDAVLDRTPAAVEPSMLSGVQFILPNRYV
jgi:hypothetical protein